LEDREPRLRVELLGPNGRGQRLQVSIPGAILTSEEEIEKAVRDEESVLMNMLPGKGHVLSALSALADSTEVERFRAEIPHYLDDYRAYLSAKRTYDVRTRLSVKLQCVAVNDGTAPAEGVLIILNVPEGPEVLDEDGMAKAPEQPEQPVAPRSTMQMMIGALQVPTLIDPSRFLDVIPRIGGESRAPKITKTNSYRIEYRRKELQHGFDATFDPFYCVFPSHEAVTSFSIDYEIHAKNLAHHTKGQVNLILQVA
jgi:hypothetical protein